MESEVGEIFFANSQNCRNGKELQTKDFVNYLGVHFDSTLSWQKRIIGTRLISD